MDRETATERSQQVGFGAIAIGVALMVGAGIAKAAWLGERDTRAIALADLAVGPG
jgi:hypothetical protein